MAVSALLSPKVFIGSYNWTTNANQLEFGAEAATLDVTTFDYVAGGFTNSVAGLKTLTFNAAGFNDYAAGALDEWLRSNYGTKRVVSLAYEGEATTNKAAIGYGLLGGYRPHNVTVGQVPTQTGVVQGGVFAEGQVTQITSSTVTATGHSTPVNIGAVSASQSIYAAIHVASVTGTTPSLTCQLESSTSSGGSYTLRGSAGTALSAAGDQWISAAGAFTDTWWKLAYTVSGTSPVFTVFAVLAIV